MIDGLELLKWAETAKILSVGHSPGADGNYYYGIDFTALRAKICALEGITVKEVIGDDTERTEGRETVLP